jgi:hypothetical protein
MPDSFHDLNFSQDPFLVILVLDCVLVDDLDGDFLAGGYVDSLLDLAESALAEGLAQTVLCD